MDLEREVHRFTVGAVCFRVQFRENMHESFSNQRQSKLTPKDECNLKSLKKLRMFVFTNYTRKYTNHSSSIHFKTRLRLFVVTIFYNIATCYPTVIG